MSLSKSYTLLLGSNIGNRKYYITDAITQLDNIDGIITAKSNIYESAPWGFEAKTWFLNQVIILETKFSPHHMLNKCQEIEAQLGRTRKNSANYESRCIDIDILFSENKIINTPELTIPHLHLHERRFTLLPLNELIPDFIHPVLKTSITDLLKGCKDDSEVHLF